MAAPAEHEGYDLHQPGAQPTCQTVTPVTRRSLLSHCEYLQKWRGLGEGLFPPYPSANIFFWSFVASFIGISVCALLTYTLHWREHVHIDGDGQLRLQFIIGSFGATAVLIYGTVDSPLAQPRNVLGGHLVSAIVGVAVAEIFEASGFEYGADESWLWLECGLAVALAILAMQSLRMVHPPGGATALIAVTSPTSQRNHGLFILVPVMSGVVVMVLIALIVNNITRQYPMYWWRPTLLDILVAEDSTHHSAMAYGEAFHRGQPDILLSHLHKNPTELVGIRGVQSSGRIKAAPGFAFDNGHASSCSGEIAGDDCHRANGSNKQRQQSALVPVLLVDSEYLRLQARIEELEKDLLLERAKSR
eukprot:SM000119S25664  [mRNA]  locus=s119:426006:427580:+ [translate_table: standard]